MFGLSLNLGHASNNYAEYVGLILAQLFSAMFKRTTIDIVTDSQLVVNQFKGNSLVANIRLQELVRIVIDFLNLSRLIH